MTMKAQIRFPEELLEEALTVVEVLGKDPDNFFEEATKKHLAANKAHQTTPTSIPAGKGRTVIVSFCEAGTLSEIDNVCDITGASVGSFIREAIRAHIEHVKTQPDFLDLLQELRERTLHKLNVIDRLS